MKHKYPPSEMLSRPGNGASEALRLEVPQLLHEVRALHERHVGEVKVAQDLVEEGATFKLLILTTLLTFGYRIINFMYEALILSTRWLQMGRPILLGQTTGRTHP